MEIGKLFKEKRLIIVLLAVIGVIFLLIGSENSSNRAKTTTMTFSYEEYERALEQKIEDFCACVDGIVNVKAFVTLEASMETRYAQNSTVGSAQSTYEYLLYGSESVLPIYEIAPIIRGIAVACDGGNDAYVQKMLTELISSATGVPTNKIKIVGYG